MFVDHRSITLFLYLNFSYFSFHLVTEFVIDSVTVPAVVQNSIYPSLIYHLLVITLIFLLGSKVYFTVLFIAYLSYLIRYLSLRFVLVWVKTTFIQKVQSVGERVEIYDLCLYSPTKLPMN